MRALIDGLLDLSRVTRAPLLRSEVDVTALAHELVDELRVADPGRRVEVDIEAGLTAQADPVLLRALLVNLLDNAWKFTAKAAAPAISVTRDDGALRIHDNGDGFDMRYAGKLFDVFQRLHADEEFPGTVWGWRPRAASSSVTEGSIRAEARPGEGASFWVRL